MFKNTLFLKIIFVFLFPAMGMLYFNSLLVSDKIEVQKQSNKIQNNIKYIKDIEELIHSLQKERGLSSTYISSKKFKEELDKQRIITNKRYDTLLNNNSKVNQNSLNNLKKLQIAFHFLDLFRNNIDNFTTSALVVIKEFSSINELLLETIDILSHIQLTIKFDNNIKYMNNLLIAKEQAGIERATTLFMLSEVFNYDYKAFDLLKKVYLIEEVNIKQFLAESTVDESRIYKKEVNPALLNKIKIVRDKLHRNTISEIISIEEWWELSTERIDALEKVYQYVAQKIFNEAKVLKEEAYLSQILSVIFLFITIIIIIILLVLLRQIILTEQKSIIKIKKQQSIYKILNSTNKFLMKPTTEEKLFNKIIELISKDINTSFSAIYKKNKYNNFVLSYQDNKVDDIIQDNMLLFNQVLENDKNIIINDLKEKKDIFHNYMIKNHNLNSVIVFPIQRFNEIDEILVIFSKEEDYFDKELEILFESMIHDISHALEKIYYEKERKIREDELRIISYAFETNEPMLITDENVKIINANEAFCNVMGYKKENILGKNPSMFKSKYHDKDFYHDMWNCINKTGSWSGEIYNKIDSKHVLPLLSTITAVKDANGIIKHYLAQYINISEQKEKIERLEYHATHDYLTDLPNRLLLLDRIEHAIEKIVRNNFVGGLIFIDLDNFKEVNDTLGHEIGDKLLIEVSKTLKECVRNEDTVARIGGDEFIILSDCIGNDKEEAKLNIINLAKKIKSALNAIEKIDGHKNISTPSIGITLFSDDSVGVTDIIKQADTAMYEAKRQGKNKIEFFS